MSNRKPKLRIRLRRIHSTLEAAKQLISDFARETEPLEELRTARVASILNEIDLCLEAADNGKWGIRYSGKIGKLYYDGLTDNQICEKLGCSDGAVCSWRLHRELPPNKSREELALRAKRRKLYNLGWCDKEIAEAIGHTTGGVISWRFRRNLPPNYEKDRPVKKHLTKRGKRV